MDWFEVWNRKWRKTHQLTSINIIIIINKHHSKGKSNFPYPFHMPPLKPAPQERAALAPLVAEALPLVDWRLSLAATQLPGYPSWNWQRVDVKDEDIVVSRRTFNVEHWTIANIELTWFGMIELLLCFACFPFLYNPFTVRASENNPLLAWF